MAKLTTLVSIAASLVTPTLAEFNPQSSSNLALYWGQNSASGNETQSTLLNLCRKTEANIIPISFVTNLQSIAFDLSSASGGCTPLDHPRFKSLTRCPEIGNEIMKCQAIYNKTILLSLGGATYTEGGFNNTKEAQTAAHNLWDIFGFSNKTGASLFKSWAQRPFGPAIVDGFDLDFEDTVYNMPAFALELRRLMDTSPRRRGLKNYLLTAAPQCSYPDVANENMLNGTVPFDAVFVQFYNNWCELNHFNRFSKNQRRFNFQVWDEWANRTSKNKDVKVFLGMPADPSAAGSGYVDAKVASQIIRYASTFPSFGGVMMWDASQTDKNEGFLQSVASVIGALLTMLLMAEKDFSFVTYYSKVASAERVGVPLGLNASLRDVLRELRNSASKAPKVEAVAATESSKEYVDRYHKLSAAELDSPKPPQIASASIERVSIPKPGPIKDDKFRKKLEKFPIKPNASNGGRGLGVV